MSCSPVCCVFSVTCPMGPTAFPTPKDSASTATKAATKPPSLIGVRICQAPSFVRCGSVGDLVARLADCGADLFGVDGRLAGDGETSRGEVDVDVGHARHLADLLGHREDAVIAGHAGDGVVVGAHGGTPYPYQV